ncbi:Acetyl esterase [Brevundimonas subvibrioides]|uniref:alpha/beta hydrolase n=1 Tax=Brevundimonas subvibrioides TaxID=74313 RepID=UPI0032D5914F
MGLKQVRDPSRDMARPSPGGTAAIDPLLAVDPELREAARQIMAEPGQPLTLATIAQVRTLWPVPPALEAPTPQPETLRIPGGPGDPEVPLQVIGRTRAGAARPAIVHMHGGGLVSGTAAHSTAFCQMLAAEFDCVVVNVDYRRAPETPYPGPVEDNYAALKWTHENADDLGIDRRRIALMGESAGGGLAAMLALLARDRGEIPVCFQLLIYPMLDDRTGRTHRPAGAIGQVGWSAEANAFGWSAFLGGEAGRGAPPPGSVPARVEDLTRLPATFIGVGAVDLFVDEDMAYARRLVQAGVATELHVAPGAFHAFDFVVPEARVSRAFTAAWKAALAHAFAPA